jgi:hypothetical protein
MIPKVGDQTIASPVAPDTASSAGGEETSDDSAIFRRVVIADSHLQPSKRQKTMASPDWQQDHIDDKKIQIGTLVIVRHKGENVMGKVTAKRNGVFTAQRWETRARSREGLRKAFFPCWSKEGVIISARPPRGASPVLFDFTLRDIKCSGFNLRYSVPDDEVVEFVRNRGFAVAVVTTNGVASRSVTLGRGGAGTPIPLWGGRL